MLLNVFEDTCVRVFSKNSDIDFKGYIYKNFVDWAKENEFSVPLYGPLPWLIFLVLIKNCDTLNV